MQQLLQSLQPALARAFSSALGTTIVVLAIFMITLLLLLPLYFVLRRRGSGTGLTIQFGSSQARPRQPMEGATFAGQTVPGQVQPMAGQAPDWPIPPTGQPWEDRREVLLHKLDRVERGLERFYVVLLSLIMAVMTGIAVFLYAKFPNDPNRSFLVLYGGVAYLMGMLLCASQLSRIMRRLSPPPDIISSMRSRINVTYQMASPADTQVHYLDNSALDRAQHHLDAGGTLDEACAILHPRYLGMNGLVQGAFRQAVQAALEERRKRQGQ